MQLAPRADLDIQTAGNRTAISTSVRPGQRRTPGTWLAEVRVCYTLQRAGNPAAGSGEARTMTRSHENRRRTHKPGHALPHESPAIGGEPAAPQPVRLQKVMAQAGVGSRRHCEELIATGRVEVDGQTVSELGTKVDPDQEVRVDSVLLSRPHHVYFLVNKPTGVVSTNFDPSGRTRVVDLLPPMRERLFTVGRLDMSSEGLILVTNDGELANRLAHPRYGVEKTYHVVVAGTPEREVLDTLRRGVHLAEGLARATSVRVRKMFKQSTLLEIVLSEGKNREIRRILAKVGHKVLRLKRVAIGRLRLAGMAPGEVRRLTTHELRSLRGSRPAKTKNAGTPRPRRGNDRAASRPTRPFVPAAAHGHDRGAGSATPRRRRGKRR